MHGPHCTGRWDHPHASGEQVFAGGKTVDDAGPSPRVRAAATVPGGLHLRGGAIPASAGAVGALGPERTDRGDHPYGYEEQPRSTTVARAPWGPGPPERGADAGLAEDRAVLGTIPVRAESSMSTRRSSFPKVFFPA